MKRTAEWARGAAMLAAMALGGGGMLWASATAAWEMNTYADFVKRPL